MDGTIRTIEIKLHLLFLFLSFVYFYFLLLGGGGGGQFSNISFLIIRSAILQISNTIFPYCLLHYDRHD